MSECRIHFSKSLRESLHAISDIGGRLSAH